MQYSISILVSVNVNFEQRLDALNSSYSGNLPFKIVDVLKGCTFNGKRMRCLTYVIDFVDVDSYKYFVKWCSLNGF